MRHRVDELDADVRLAAPHHIAEAMRLGGPVQDQDERVGQDVRMRGRDARAAVRDIPQNAGDRRRALAVADPRRDAGLLALMVPDVDKSRDFYTDLLGMKVIYYKPGDVLGVDTPGGPVCFMKFGDNYLYLRKSQHPEHKPYVAHFAPAVENYDQAAVRADLIRRGYKPTADSKYGWSIRDPAGMRVEVAGKGLPEHVAGDCNGGNANCPGGPDK